VFEPLIWDQGEKYGNRKRDSFGEDVAGSAESKSIYKRGSLYSQTNIPAAVHKAGKPTYDDSKPRVDVVLREDYSVGLNGPKTKHLDVTPADYQCEKCQSEQCQ
jgi:hypothetical protein